MKQSVPCEAVWSAVRLSLLQRDPTHHFPKRKLDSLALQECPEGLTSGIFSFEIKLTYVDRPTFLEPRALLQCKEVVTDSPSLIFLAVWPEAVCGKVNENRPISGKWAPWV